MRDKERRVHLRTNKKGQVALFVILAVVIVAAILIFLLVRRSAGPTLAVGAEVQPKSFVEKCIKDIVNEAADRMVKQGGFLEPRDYKVYNDVKATYLCKNEGYFAPCINQHPMLLNEIKQQILNFSNPKIETCFRNMKSDLEGKGYTVDMGEMNLTDSLGPGKIFVDIGRTIKLTKNEQTLGFEEINIEINNPIYDLAKVALDITEDEAKRCYFEYVGYSLRYNQFLVQTTSMSDSTKIYIIKDKNSNKEMYIAIRGCAVQPGM